MLSEPAGVGTGVEGGGVIFILIDVGATGEDSRAEGERGLECLLL